jgi:arylsulfatase A-like enzyme
MAHHDNPAHLGIRTQDYKLIYFYGQPLDAKGALPNATTAYWELYDLKKDPHEMNNVVDQPDYSETLATLRKQLIELQAQVDDTTPEIEAR